MKLFGFSNFMKLIITCKLHTKKHDLNVIKRIEKEIQFKNKDFFEISLKISQCV